MRQNGNSSINKYLVRSEYVTAINVACRIKFVPMAMLRDANNNTSIKEYAFLTSWLCLKTFRKVDVYYTIGTC